MDKDLARLSNKKLRSLAALAKVMWHIADARAHGLLGGGPAINVKRCDEIWEFAKKRGCLPGDDLVDATLDLVVQQLANRGQKPRQKNRS